MLITNDDGISSKGILAVEKVFKKRYNTFLIAPLRERSVTSMALTVFDSLRVEKVYEDHYIVDGYPVDCVNIGLHGRIFPEIDFVISGINRGVNMGNDVHYSGTAGAARHAAIHGLPSFALSCGDVRDEADYIREAELFLEFFEANSGRWQKGHLYNINFPQNHENSLDAFRFVPLGTRTYVDTYKVTDIVGNISEFYLGGSDLGYKDEPGTDFYEFYRGRIPVTPLELDVTHRSELDRLWQNTSTR